MILLYVMTIGMIAPLAPGITEVSPERAKTGKTIALSVKGYNSNFTQVKEPIRAWLKIDTAHAICGNAIKVLDDQRLEIAFTIPNYLPGSDRIQPATLILNNDADGSSIFPNAVFIEQDSLRHEEVTADWETCTINAANLFSVDRYDYPFRNILTETIRNLYFHVPMWFGMIFIFIGSLVYSIRYLQKKRMTDDIKAKAYASTGILFGILGIMTGGIWAQYTWGAFWSFDIKQNMSAIALLIYLAYFVLRGSFDDYEKRARIGAVYNIFAFATLIPLLFVIPRLYASLHPGNGGNPGFGGEDLDNTMRTVFYPAVIGWTLLGFWLGELLYRLERVKYKMMGEEL